MILCEDTVGYYFFLQITAKIFSNYIKSQFLGTKNKAKCSFPNNVLKTLAESKVADFKKYVYILDPDKDSKNMLNKKIKNLLTLPGSAAIEKLMYFFLKKLRQNSIYWENPKWLNCSSEECFKKFNLLTDNDNNIDKFKKWLEYCQKKEFFARNNIRLYKLWAYENQNECFNFCMLFLLALKSVNNLSVINDEQKIVSAIEKKYKK